MRNSLGKNKIVECGKIDRFCSAQQSVGSMSPPKHFSTVALKLRQRQPVQLSWGSTPSTHLGKVQPLPWIVLAAIEHLPFVYNVDMESALPTTLVGSAETNALDTNLVLGSPY